MLQCRAMNGKQTDIRVSDCRLYLLPIETRVPLKFGNATLSGVICARACVTVETRDGRRVEGWGETPLSVQWVWPSVVPYREREEALVAFARRMAREWRQIEVVGHPMEIGSWFLNHALEDVLAEYNQAMRAGSEPIPHLAGLVAASPFDIAVHDAFGVAHGVATYETYSGEYMNSDLSAYLPDDEGVRFTGRYPGDFLESPSNPEIPAWHLVGGKDRVSPEELDGSEPDDGYPVLLGEWIARDGLRCLKVKLTGTDAEWDYDRLRSVGEIAVQGGVDWLTADFNCQVRDPAYVTETLDRLKNEAPRLYGMLLYVEQPFPYDLEAHPIDVHAVSARKPLFMDESAHDWRIVRRGFGLGWTGVALKTCKTQTGALLSLSWAKAHGMTLMVQDLTNPMLAQIPHLQLGYYAGTIMGVETNSMQFYPEASKQEAQVHPGLYSRRGGTVDLSSCLGRPGFGYRIGEIGRELPPPVAPN